MMHRFLKKLRGRRASKAEAVARQDIGKTVFPLTFPDQVTDHLRTRYAQADSILEYGSGGSTQLAVQLGVPCLTVESDRDWAAALTSHLEAQFGEAVSARIQHVDIGATKAWGYPVDASRWSEYWRYPMQVWRSDHAPDPTLILIDGRMRKACFATALLHVKRETIVLFDDYTDRPYYHDIEGYVKPAQFLGRMAEFVITPGMINHAEFQNLIPWFFDLR